MFPTFCGTRCRETKNANPSKNYSPPIQHTRILFLLTPDMFYARFLEFSVCHLLPSFFNFLNPSGPHWTMKTILVLLLLLLLLLLLPAAAACQQDLNLHSTGRQQRVINWLNGKTCPPVPRGAYRGPPRVSSNRQVFC